MANRQTGPVSYRRFEPDPVLSEGLLSVARDNGDLERRAAAGLKRMADEAAGQAEQIALREGRKAGAAAGYAAQPGTATVTPAFSGTASVNGQAGHVVGAQGGAAVRTGNAAAAAARDYLIQKHGLSPIAAAAVAGHGMQESNFNLKAVGDSGSAYGIFQWRGERLANLKQFAASSGRDWHNQETQLDFAMHELKTSEKTAGDALSRASTIEDAVAAFMHFERPAGYSRDNPRGGHGYGNRLGYARGLIGGAPTQSASNQTTAVERPAEMRPGSSNQVQLRGGNTIYDRAYDEAATKGYLETLKFTMLQDQQAVYDAYKDDPARLQKAMGELETAHMRDHVIPEIAGDYSLDFKKGAFLYVEKAREEKRRREDEQARVEYLDRAGQLETQKAQILAVDTPNPAALKTVQDTIDSHYDQAVARGIMRPDEAADAKRKSQNTMTAAFYLNQAKGKKPEEIDAMRRDIAKDFSEGQLPDVDGETYATIQEGLEAQVSRRRTQDEVANKALQARGDELVRKASRGQAVDPADLARFEVDGNTAPKGREIVTSTFARARVADALRNLPLGQVEAKLDKLLSPDGKPPSPDDVEFARGMIKEFRQAVLTDPLGKAEAIGLVPAVNSIPVDGSATPDDIRAAIAYRRGAAEAVAQHFGVPVKYFRPGEAEAVMAASLENPDALVTFTQSVADTFGPQAGRVMSEFSEAGPTLAHGAGVALATGDLTISRDIARALGAKQRGELPKTTPETGRALTSFGATALGGALSLDDRTQSATLQTAQLLFEQEAQRRGIDAGDIRTAGSPAQDLFLKSLDRALGARTVNGVDYGGLGQINGRSIVVPADMQKDEPEAILSNLTDADLTLLPPIAKQAGGTDAGNVILPSWSVTAKQLRAANFVSAGDGVYLVALGDPDGPAPRWLTTPDGRKWQLDIRQLRDMMR